jgi:hypothetical protein
MAPARARADGRSPRGVGERLTRGLAAVGAAAGALMVAGSVLDWSGVEYSSALDRGLALAAGAVVILSAALAVVWRRELLGLAVVGGALGLNMAIVNIRDIDGHRYEYVTYPEASVGIGLYAVLVGAVVSVLVAVASFAPLSRRRS